MTLDQAWRETLRQGPQALAAIEVESGRRWTRAGLQAWAERLAGGPLRAARGSTLAYSLPNTAEWLAVFLAALALSAAVVPLDPSLPPAQQDRQAAALGLRFVWRDGALREVGPGARAAGRMRVGKLTSGSSGAPRLIRCNSGHLLADGLAIARTMRVRPADRNLALVPLGHSYGLGNLVVPLLLQGTPVVLARAFVPRQALPWIERYGVSVLPAVPALLRLLADLPGTGRPGKLRLVVSAGARLPRATAEAFRARFGLRVHDFYGSSETGGICYDRRGAAARQAHGIGPPLEGVQVQITARGRVRVRSGAVAAGRGGAFTLPDLGRISPEGRLEILGRSGRVANLGGRNFHPRELEARLAALPGVAEAWVGVFETGGRDFLAAAVETAESQNSLAAALAAQCPPWQLPRAWFVARQLPRNARGKLDAAALRAHFGVEG